MSFKIQYAPKLLLHFVFLVLSLRPLASTAQHTLSGTILTSEKKGALAGASILIQPGEHATTSSKNGNFSISNLPEGSYTIHISYLGYEAADDTLVLHSDQIVSFEMKKKTYDQQEILVNATRTAKDNGFSYTNISHVDLQKQNLAQDIPYMLAFTPSLVTTSDAGAGVGYTGVRIRGSDASRINVTINGVPLNDAESQNVYFVDLPDLASSVENIQVQRGVGSSTNGAGAFGGSINIMTNKQTAKPYVETSHAFGSFNTIKNNLSLGTGLLHNHWGVEARISRIHSNGYIDRARSDLQSYYFSGGYFSSRAIVKFTFLSGKEITYQAWNGVPENLLKTDRTFNSFTYKNQVDNYKQDHYQLLLGYDLLKDLHLQVTLHDTKGKGYYEEYKTADDLYGEGLFSFYGLPNPVIGNDTITSTNLVRRKWLDNSFYGAVWALSYEPQNIFNVILGGGWNHYLGDHYNQLTWMQYAVNTPPDYTYNSDDAGKSDFNVYIKSSVEPFKNFHVTGDVQVRQVGYRFKGFNESLSYVPQADHLLFFNPKLGLSWNFSRLFRCYTSVSTGSKEPSRDDYTESSRGSRPKPEKMTDVEAGLQFIAKKISVSVNYYWMYYSNQLVLTGKVNEVGNYTRINIPNSYRQGLELEFRYDACSLLSLQGNATVSENKIRSFDEYIDNYDNGKQKVTNHRRTTLAFSPAFLTTCMATVMPLKKLNIDFIIRHAGKQYLDNTSNETRKINDYTVADIRLNYTIAIKSIAEIQLSLTGSNIFSKKYVSNGYTYSYISGGKFTTENFYYPQALFHLIGQVSFRF